MALCTAGAGAQDAIYDSYIASASKASEKGDIASAEKFLKLAVNEVEGNEEKLIQTWHRLAVAQDRLFKYSEAERNYKQALERLEKRTKGKKEDRLFLAHSLALYANHCRLRGKFEEAEASYKKALTIREKLNGPRAWETAQLLRDIADNHRDAGRYEAAEPVYRSAISMLTGQKGREYHLAFCLANLGELMLLTERVEEAEAVCRQGLEIYREKNLNVPLNRAFCQATLGEVLARQGKTEEAEGVFAAGLKDLEASGPAGPRALPLLKRAAKFYRANGRTGEAGKLEATIKSIEEKHLKANEQAAVK
jgi:tetratricopeptide (TPR) repeat protein